MAGAAVLTCLAFNLRSPGRARALVSMGDAGSLMLGYLVAWLLVHSSQGEARLLAPATALWLALLPLFDTVWLIANRAARRRWPTAPGDDHLHHQLLHLGLSPGQTVAVMAALGAIAAVGGLAAERAGVPEHHLCSGFLARFALYRAVMSSAWRRRRMKLRPTGGSAGRADRHDGLERR